MMVKVKRSFILSMAVSIGLHRKMVVAVGTRDRRNRGVRNPVTSYNSIANRGAKSAKPKSDSNDKGTSAKQQENPPLRILRPGDPEAVPQQQTIQIASLMGNPKCEMSSGHLERKSQHQNGNHTRFNEKNDIINPRIVSDFGVKGMIWNPANDPIHYRNPLLNRPAMATFGTESDGFAIHPESEYISPNVHMQNSINIISTMKSTRPDPGPMDAGASHNIFYEQPHSQSVSQIRSIGPTHQIEEENHNFEQQKPRMQCTEENHKIADLEHQILSLRTDLQAFGKIHGPALISPPKRLNVVEDKIAALEQEMALLRNDLQSFRNNIYRPIPSRNKKNEHIVVGTKMKWIPMTNIDEEPNSVSEEVVSSLQAENEALRVQLHQWKTSQETLRNEIENLKRWIPEKMENKNAQNHSQGNDLPKKIAQLEAENENLLRARMRWRGGCFVPLAAGVCYYLVTSYLQKS